MQFLMRSRFGQSCRRTGLELPAQTTVDARLTTKRAECIAGFFRLFAGICFRLSVHPVGRLHVMLFLFDHTKLPFCRRSHRLYAVHSWHSFVLKRFVRVTTHRLAMAGQRRQYCHFNINALSRRTQQNCMTIGQRKATLRLAQR
jgi:hypothetical protein